MATLINKTVGSVFNVVSKSMRRMEVKRRLCQNYSESCSQSCSYLPSNQIGILGSSKFNFHVQFRTLSTTQTYHDDLNVYFTKKHEWVAIAEDIGTVGITDYAQQALGDVVYAQLPEVDADVIVGEECGALESVKAASELYSPVSGTVVEKNSAVEDLPALINSSALDEGWLFKVKLSNTEELKDLLDQSSYDEYLKTQEDDH